MVEQNIKVLRKTLGLSQAAFGEKLGESRDVIGNIGCKRGGQPVFQPESDAAEICASAAEGTFRGAAGRER